MILQCKVCKVLPGDFSLSSLMPNTFCICTVSYFCKLAESEGNVLGMAGVAQSVVEKDGGRDKMEMGESR